MLKFLAQIKRKTQTEKNAEVSVIICRFNLTNLIKHIRLKEFWEI